MVIIQISPNSATKILYRLPEVRVFPKNTTQIKKARARDFAQRFACSIDA